VSVNPRRICTIEDCEKVVIARDLCDKHYRKWNLYGDPLYVHPIFDKTRVCVIEDCDNKQSGGARGWCSKHYNRWARTGDPLGFRKPQLTNEERFWLKIDKNGPLPAADTLAAGLGPCWVWTGFRDRFGYGDFNESGRHKRAHRYAYLLVVGDIPDGLTLDHLCRVTSCVNPEHLEPVTAKVNTLRGNSITAIQANKTHCKRGHPFSGDNLYVIGGKRPGRACRTCARIHRRASDARKRARAS
jgi:hypothetical protein